MGPFFNSSTPELQSITPPPYTKKDKETDLREPQEVPCDEEVEREHHDVKQVAAPAPAHVAVKQTSRKKQNKTGRNSRQTDTGFAQTILSHAKEGLLR